MYVCMYVCMYVTVYVTIFFCIKSSSLCMYVRMNVCMYVCMYVVYVAVVLYTRPQVYLCIYVLYLCTVCMYVVQKMEKDRLEAIASSSKGWIRDAYAHEEDLQSVN